jgi:hypothetical protein
MRIFTADEWQVHILHARNDAAIFRQFAAKYPQDASEYLALAKHAEERENVILMATDRMQTRMKEKEQKMRVQGWLMNVVVLLALLLVAGTIVHAQPATAQDVSPTVEPMLGSEDVQPIPEGQGGGESIPIGDTLAQVLPWIFALLIGLMIPLALVLWKFGAELGKSAPQWAWDMSKSAGNAGMTNLGTYVSSTKTKMDDAAYAELREMFNQFIQDVESRRSQASGGSTTDPAKAG